MEQAWCHTSRFCRCSVSLHTLGSPLHLARAMKTTVRELEAEREMMAEPAIDPEQQVELEQLAYRYWQERGCPTGSPEEDWYRAEAELRRRQA
jgi:hypothetical protein